MPAYHNTFCFPPPPVPSSGHRASALRGLFGDTFVERPFDATSGCGIVLTYFPGSEAHRHPRGQGMGGRTRVNKSWGRGWSLLSLRTGREGAESDREWRVVPAAPFVRDRGGENWKYVECSQRRYTTVKCARDMCRERCWRFGGPWLLIEHA